VSLSTFHPLYLSLRRMLTFCFLHPFSHIKAMLKSLYDHFVVLYNAVLPQNPSLASEHALRQEQEIYDRTTKSTYRNVIIFRLVLAENR